MISGKIIKTSIVGKLLRCWKVTDSGEIISDDIREIIPGYG